MPVTQSNNMGIPQPTSQNMPNQLQNKASFQSQQNMGRSQTAQQQQPQVHAADQSVPNTTNPNAPQELRNVVMKMPIPPILLKTLTFLPPDVNTWPQIFRLIQSNSISKEMLPIVKSVHTQHENWVRTLYAQQQMQRQQQQQQQQQQQNVDLVQVGAHGHQKPGMSQNMQQQFNANNNANNSPMVSINSMIREQPQQLQQPIMSGSGHQQAMTIPHQYPVNQNTTPLMHNMNLPQQANQQSMFNSNVQEQSPQRTQVTPQLGPQVLPQQQQQQQQQRNWMGPQKKQGQPQQIDQHNQGEMNISGQKVYGNDQQERDRVRLHELYEEVGNSKAKSQPLDLSQEEAMKVRASVTQIQEACRQLERLIQWAHISLRNETVTRKLIYMQLAYREQFEAMNRGIFYFNLQSIMQFRQELSKVFNFVRRTQQKNVPGGNLQPGQAHQAVSPPMAQASPRFVPQQVQSSPIPSQQPLLQNQASSSSFDGNVMATHQQPTRGRGANAQVQQQQNQQNLPNEGSVQQQKPQQSFMAVTQVPVANARGRGRGKAQPQVQSSTTQATIPISTPANFISGQTSTADNLNITLPATSTKMSPTSSFSGMNSPQGVPVYTQTAPLDASQLKLPQNRKRSATSKVGGSSPVVELEPPLKKEKTETKGPGRGRPPSSAAKYNQAQTGPTFQQLEEASKQKAAVLAEEEATKRRELAQNDPLSYALQAIAEVCAVDPITGNSLVTSEKAPILSLAKPLKVLYTSIV
ncbi:hypothetical protein V1514DRAFT_331812 [Lipomyces japonicus]|uniref:uncharacterized protein n=1 Tax=Lipomyces japonicus TaxID=56871 RepID=UPI0034CF9759